MNPEHENYTYRAHCSEEDQAYVGLCVEFPSLSWLDASPRAASAGIHVLVAEVIADLQANQEPAPPCLS
ncbi:antitoxin HicB [bacterium]|nr:antitoxin HicB [bacterium]